MSKSYSILANISDIPQGKYEGYFWLSDADGPNVLDLRSDIDRKLLNKPLPFVLEANFYDRDQEISIHIKNVDGKHYITMVDFRKLTDELVEEVPYLAYKVKANTYIMAEAWEKVQDPLLENMYVYQPSWSAFKGFSPLQKK